MATVTSVSSNYAGKEAGAIIGKTFKEADTLRLGLVTIAPNVGYALNMRRVRYTDGTTAYSCGFDPQGTVTLNERVLTPVKLKNDLQICKEDFRATWSQETMGASASNPNAPADIMEAIQVEVLGQTAEDVDNIIWNGDSANVNEWDGFLKLFLADSGVIDVDIDTVTENNVVAQLKLALGAIPIALRRKTLNVMVSPDVFQFYSFSLTTPAITNGLGAEERQMKFGRYTLTEVNGLPTSTIVIAEAKNLVFGTGLEADFNQLAMVDEDEVGLLTGQIRMKMVYSGGVQYYNSEEIVWARPIA
jgi:hypothetical protein